MIFWILNFIPAGLIHALLLLGIIGIIVSTVLGSVPFIGKYATIIRVISFALCLSMPFLEGILSEQQHEAVAVAELKQQVAEVEANGAAIVTRVVEKIVVKKEIITQHEAAIIQYVDREITKYDSQCVLPPAVIMVHNAAAANADITLKDVK